MSESEIIQTLQPLKIPGGWKVVFNNFFTLDPKTYTGTNDEFWRNLVEDMLYLVFEWSFKKDKKIYHKKIALDLGWYPEANANGQFTLFVIKDDNWDSPLAEFSSRSQSQIVNTIESWLIEYSQSCYRV